VLSSSATKTYRDKQIGRVQVCCVTRSVDLSMWLVAGLTVEEERRPLCCNSCPTYLNRWCW